MKKEEVINVTAVFSTWIALLFALYSSGLSVFILLMMAKERASFYKLLSDLPEKKRSAEEKRHLSDRLRELKEKWRALPTAKKGGEKK